MRRALLVILATSLSAFASDWPQWRGPSGQGHCEDKNLPLTWGGADNTNVLWKVSLPKADISQSSPIVWKERVFAMTALNKPEVEHHVTCFQKSDGKQLWDTSVPPGPWLLTDLRGGYCCSTPATDGERVYCVFGSAIIVALDLDGKIVWRKELNPRTFDVAISASPLVYKDTVLLLCDMTAGKSYLIAYDAKTGETKWETKRPTAGFNHSTPLLTEINGKKQLVIASSNALQGVDPENGTVLWFCAAKGDVATPAFGGGLVYSDEGRGNPGVCVDPTGSGDVTKTHLKWTMKGRTNGFNSPLIVGEHLYRLSSDLRCFNVVTGEELWAERLGGDFSPSPIATADGLIYYASSGASWVLKAGPKFELLGKSDLGDPSACSPAVSDGKIILKGNKFLFCVGKK